MTTSPYQWRLGTSPATEELTLYAHDNDSPQGRFLGMMRRPEDAKLARDAVNAYGQPSPIEEDLWKGFHESERRRKIAAVVAGYHQECLAGLGAVADTEAVIEAFNAVLAALGGKTDPVLLGVADSPLVIEQVGVILTCRDAEAEHG